MSVEPLETMRIESTGGHCAFVVEPARATVVGRGPGSPETDVVVDDRRVARRHLVFRHDGGAAYVRDAGSPGGAWLDGRRLQGELRLGDGQRIELVSGWALEVRAVRGTSLWDHLRDGPLPVARILQALLGPMQTLARLHALGRCVVEFSPRDVFVERDRGHLSYASRPIGPFPAGRTWGNPTYMAVDTLAQGALTAAADVYTMGLMLYEGVAGRRPFDGACGATAQVMLKATTDPTLPGEPDPALAALVAGCMHRDPARRPSAEQAAAGIADLLRQADPAGGP